MNERDEPMKGLPEFLRGLADSAVVKLMTAYAGESRLLGWASEVEASRQRSAVGAEPDGNLNLVWNTLRFFCSESSYTTGERTGGVLAGCPRDPAPTVAEMANYARWGMAALQRFLGQEPEAWLLEGSPAPPSERPAAPAQAGVTDAMKTAIEAMEDSLEDAQIAQSEYDGRTYNFCTSCGADDLQTPVIGKHNPRCAWTKVRAAIAALKSSLLAGTPPPATDGREDGNG